MDILDEKWQKANIINLLSIATGYAKNENFELAKIYAQLAVNEIQAYLKKLKEAVGNDNK